MIRNEASQNQVDAANPTLSTWLSANAGSGKTRVLTDRVARLLLEGVSPQNILCLTYTKAAAAEMQNRLFKRLGGWAMLDDKVLRADLANLGVEGVIAPEKLSAARRLFARAIETPGGLKIQTIHSFCASILRRFPLEAGVSPNFREIEDRTSALMRAEVLDGIALGDQSDLLADVLRHFGGGDLDKLVKEVAGRSTAFSGPLDDAALRETLGVAPGATLDSLLGAIFNVDTAEIIRDLIVACRTGGTTDNRAADKLATVNLTAPNTTDLMTLEGIFLFGETAKSPFGPKIDSFPTKGVRQAHPDLTEALGGLMDHVAAAREDRLALTAYARASALHRFAHVFVQAYAQKKTALGVLDFDDLIGKARQLLTDKAVAAWVLFRLDGGIDHLLVDEAQDTSPDQWAVIQHLTREFVSGEGARDTRRTVFVVGDKKQSIYSFQGADPAEFDRMRDYFDAALAQIDDPLQTRTLAYSFRSAMAILRVVDSTFVRDRAVGLGDASLHIPFKSDMPGRVDLWPVIAPDTTAEDPDDNWLKPVDEVSADHHLVQMANRVAAQIKRMIRDETLPVAGPDGPERRPVRAGDILILVQSRQGLLFPELIRACKQADLPIAGADVLRVGGELAVKDIAALLRFLALPEDDLSLAAALRSPLFGWTEQQLFTLAHHRPQKGYLWPALREIDGFAEAKAILHDLLDQADFLRPYDLIARLLVRHGGRQALLARLGAEAEDGIDALLAQALAYESDNVPSLTGFLTWMDTDDLTVKRQVDAKGDQIRVMTVHGAKGLEAPIVILPDAAERRNEVKSQVLSGPVPLWKTPKAQMPPAMTARHDDMLDAQARERLRLLYVAMTRAENWLIVGAAGDTGKTGTAWHDIVAEGVDHAGAFDALAGDLSVRRVESGEWHGGTLQSATERRGDRPMAEALAPLPPITRTATLSPSIDLGGDKVLAGDIDDSDDTALMRGSLVHLLLEHLPALPVADRSTVAARLIAAFPGADAVPTDGLTDAVLALIDAPHLAPIYAPDTLAEVAVTADLPGLGRIHGTIDRLIVTPNAVTAVDFKTNRIVPATADTVPEGLLRQMGAYAAALAQIYPDRSIATAILWTQTATLMDLPPALTVAALARASVP